MKNAEQIKAEAKEQIKKLLDMCGCYKYTDKGIDKWLDTWENACSPQIEAIAEKSPYYDGKCKIVFPSEYPREMNRVGINNFCLWLYNYKQRAVERIEPATYDGLTYKDTIKYRDFFKHMNAINDSNINPDLLPEDLRESYVSFFAAYSSEKIETFKSYITDIYRIFRDRDLYEVNNEYYYEDDLRNIGVYAAENLAEIISNRRAQVQFLNKWLVNSFEYYFPDCKFAEGQKLSRAVNSIASKYGLNKDPEWNREFAKYADSINPLNVTKWTVISWNPLDFLTFCFGNSWSTCSNIDKHNVRGVKIGSSRSSVTSYVDEDYVFRGEHSAAALSYMFDKTSFIYYTVNHKYDGTHYEEQDKESRIVFSLSEDNTTLLQSRLYPQCNDDNPDDSAYRIPREIVQKVIADALGNPNLWKMKKGSDICREYAKSSGVHYPDYRDDRNKECNISWMGDEPHVIYLGHEAICPNCGCIHGYTGSLNCPDCDPEYSD